MIWEYVELFVGLIYIANAFLLLRRKKMPRTLINKLEEQDLPAYNRFQAAAYVLLGISWAVAGGLGIAAGNGSSDKDYWIPFLIVLSSLVCSCAANIRYLDIQEMKDLFR